jgi:hypothetical protein
MPTQHGVARQVDSMLMGLRSRLRSPADQDRVWRSWLVATCLVAAALPACDCSSKGPTSAGATLDLSPNPVDFKEVIVGQQQQIKVIARNDGRTPILVRAISRDTGFPDDFRFAPPNVSLAAGEQQEIQVFFAPAAAGPKSGTLLFLDDASGQTTKLPLTGIGIIPQITTNPTAIDFGTVVVGDVKSQPLTINNTSTGALDVLIDPITTDHDGAFTVSVPGSDQQTVHLEANTSAQVSVSFQPTLVGQQAGTLNLRACSSCTPTPVALKGNAVASGLIAYPASIDFGAVLPKLRGTKPLTLKNIGSTPITLKTIAPELMGGVFSVDSLPTLPYTLNSGAMVMFNVDFAPVTMGPQSTRLSFDTDDPRANGVRVPLAGYGGGPIASVKPLAIDYGPVAVGFPVVRRLLVTNQGVGGSDPSRDALVVSAIDAPALAAFDVPTGGTTPITVAPGSSKVIEVRFNPTAVGPAQDSLTLHTNDATHPTIAVSLKGEGVLVGNCDYELVPSATPGLQFGIISRGRRSTLTFSIHNAGVTDCIIGKLELDQSTNTAFTLPNGPLYGQRLAPGDRLFTDVQFAPPGSTQPGTDFAGIVNINISSTRTPSIQLQLSGRANEVCITITPVSADFGVVKPMCETNDRKFRIYNACQAPVTITQITPGAGQADFVLILPPLPSPLDPQSAQSSMSMNPTSMNFSVRFHPIGVGADIGTVQVFTDEALAGGQPYVVSLAGRGDDNAVATETFVQADRASADILIIADDSGSMSSKQDKLAKNFDNFMKFALLQQVDYHIAVTTTGTDSLPTCTAPSETINGRFMPLGGANQIVTTQTPNPAQTFAQNVNVGTNGCGDEQGMEGAYRALSEPNINGVNAGFLRSDALLAIVVVSDDEDSSSRSLDFYQDFFQTLKGPHGANLVTFNTVTVTDHTVCDSNGTYYEPTAVASPGNPAGLRYEEMARRTGGISVNICDVDWSTNLQMIGAEAFGYKTRFTLSSEPDPTTVKVSIDGADVAATYWAYSAGSNSIDFLPTATPPAGSKIQVTYTVACH